MAKVDLELVKMVMTRNLPDERVVSSVIEELKRELAAQQDEPKAPQVKKQFVMMVSDPSESLPQKELVGWVFQIPEEDSPALTQEKIVKAAYDFNASPKGQRMPVETVGEACEVVGPKFFKEQNLWVKTKEPVWIIPTNNKIPKDNLSPI